MNISHYSSMRLAALSFMFLLCAGLVQAQEGFKGTVYKRPVKKAHNAGRASAARVPAKAVEANERGNAQFDEKRYEEAIVAYEEAVKLFARYAEAYFNMGDTYSSLQHYEEAIKAYKEAIKLKPNYDDAYTSLGDAYTALGRKAEADEAYNHASRNHLVGGVMNGKAIYLAQPTYPAIAHAAHASGTVVVKVLIDETGQVIRAEPISGHPLLQAASVKAASESRFSPTKLGGQPVKVSGVIHYNFQLQ